MTQTLKRILFAANAILFLLFFNWSILHKEETLKNGKLIYAELAPIDPRSLMQGDYMNLNYEIYNQVDVLEIPKRGFLRASLNEKNIVLKIHLVDDPTNSVGSNECIIKYFHNDYRMSMGAESYFFQEGEGDKYEAAKYGALKVDDQGNSILVGLYDEHLKLIQ